MAKEKKLKRVLLLLILGLASQGYAFERIKVFGTVDYLLPGNIEDSLDDADDIILDDIGVNEIPIFEGRDAQGAVGGRICLLVPSKKFEGFAWGGSVGFLDGPSAQTKAVGAGTRYDWTKFSMDNSYLRLLLEGSQEYRLSDNVRTAFGFGVGIAKAKSEQEFTGESGFPTKTGFTTEYSSSKTGLTFEVSPAVNIKVKRADISLGIRYIYLPRIAGSSDRSDFFIKLPPYEVDDSGFGFFASVGF